MAFYGTQIAAQFEAGPLHSSPWRTRFLGTNLMKVEVSAALQTRISMKEWCEKTYPETAGFAGKAGLYLNPRNEEVERYLFSPDRNPEFKIFLNAKFKKKIAQSRVEDFAGFESKRFTQQMCLNALKYVLEAGIGKRLEAFVEVEK
jgi:hypothetical protein